MGESRSRFIKVELINFVLYLMALLLFILCFLTLHIYSGFIITRTSQSSSTRVSCMQQQSIHLHRILAFILHNSFVLQRHKKVRRLWFIKIIFAITHGIETSVCVSSNCKHFIIASIVIRVCLVNEESTCATTSVRKLTYYSWVLLTKLVCYC